ncbi:MAG TPA: hypothetical protein PKI19_08150 [Elusimicrobiales bacterium]|nr:hypothetical protein [Elusimicrobiales bacterium]
MNNFPPAKLMLCALALAAGLAAPAAAQTEISKIDWEVAKLQNKTRLPYAAVEALRADPAVKFTDRLRAVVTLRNTSAKKAEGLVVSYALRMRLLKAGEPPEKAFWGVPFYFEEVRVAAVKPMSERAARVLNFGIAEQLRKFRNSGFTPTALKMEVMLSPRLGDEPAAIMKESILEILKP